jgi:ABC-type multidrug transport system fused ATPase/permease subunit
LVINNGEIIEQGSHDELIINEKGHYYNLYSKQFIDA